MRAICCAALLPILLGLSGCSTTGQTAQTAMPGPPPTPTTLTAAQQNIVKAGLKSVLKDPTSPLFGAMKAALDSSGAIFICGMVNAKNSYGGYVGDQPYIGGIDGQKFDVMMIADDDSSLTVVTNACAKDGIAP